ncbi:signal peptidase II [Patescibacteria group bacterium]|nr:signal peptidase II [Patescibacteria group bacterium]MBU1895855.1 signal peptidase II [Patescibacteria group bacterium]
MEKNTIIKYKVHLLAILLSGFFLFIDQVLKYFARMNTDFVYYIWRPWLGWEYFENNGIAFSIPFSNTLIIILTPIIILALFIILTKQKNPSKYFVLGIILIIAGAISNLVDRILFTTTIDYLRLLTWIINLADILILTGVGLLVFEEFRQKKRKKIL